MPKEIIRQVADYCWSNDFLDIFRKFFKDHADDFIDAPPLQGGEEHDLHYYSLFMDYLKVYEVRTYVIFQQGLYNYNVIHYQNTLTDHLKGLDCSIEEFYRDVRAAQHEQNDEYLQYFIDCLLASADYESFYKVMSKHGKLKKDSNPDAKADAKASPQKTRASKKGDDEDDDYDVADEKGRGPARRSAK